MKTPGWDKKVQDVTFRDGKGKGGDFTEQEALEERSGVQSPEREGNLG